MSVSGGVPNRTRAVLPDDLVRPFEVFVNGVAQREGADFRVEDSALVFPRELRREGSLGVWRWVSNFLGIAGSYRQNDSVDVVYEVKGRRVVASGLPLERA